MAQDKLDATKIVGIAGMAIVATALATGVLIGAEHLLGFSISATATTAAAGLVFLFLIGILASAHAAGEADERRGLK